MPDIKSSIIDEEKKMGCIAVSGYLDGKSLPEFSEVSEPLLTQGGVIRLILDFSDLGFISSAGIGQIVMIRQTLLDQQGKIAIVCNNQRLVSAFRHARLDQLIPLYETMDLALEYLLLPT